jgi:hypothetical protein
MKSGVAVQLKLARESHGSTQDITQWLPLDADTRRHTETQNISYTAQLQP